MARVSLGEALEPKPRPDDPPGPTSAPPFSTDLVATRPPHESARSAAAPDRYKLTVVLEDDEHAQLEALTAAVLAKVQPRRVGKGWRTKVIRALLAEAMAGEQPADAAVDRIASRLRE